MAKHNNDLFVEKIKDSTGMYYHLDEDGKKKEPAKDNLIQQKPEKSNDTYPKEISKEELAELDPTFNESMFITKVNNMFVKFFTCVMMDRLPEVNHFVDDNVYEFGNMLINAVKSKGHRQMYDELNVKNTTIKKITLYEDSYIVNVYLQSRYLDYIISLDDGNYVSGNNTTRKEVDYNIILTKKRVTKNQDIVRKCPGCGATINVNSSGKCDYCGSIYNQEDYDWVIASLEKLN